MDSKDSKDFKCVYDPVLASTKKGKTPVYVKIRNDTAASRGSDPRLNVEAAKHRGRRRPPTKPLPVPGLLVDKNWIGPQPPTHLLITNLSPLTTMGQISAELQTLGKLEKCELVVHPETAVSLGMCRVKFAGDVDVANKLAARLLATDNLRIANDHPKVVFDEDHSHERALVQELVAAKNRELEQLRRRERERLQREKHTQERDRKRASLASSDPAPADQRDETYEQWLARKIGPNDYVTVRNRLQNTPNVYKDLYDTLRICSFQNIFWHPQRGYHVTFNGAGRARRCYDQLHQTRMKRSGKFLQLVFHEHKRVDPFSEAVKQIMTEFKSRLVEDIRRRVVLPTIFSALDPAKYAHLERKSPSPIIAASVGESALAGESATNGAGNGTENYPKTPQKNQAIDYTKLHFRKRPGSNHTTPIKRRKLTLEELESDDEQDSDTGGDDELMSDIHDIEHSSEVKQAAAVAVQSIAEEEPEKPQEDEDTAMLDSPRLPLTCSGRRPVPLAATPSHPLLLSDLQTVVETEEDWQYLVAALGAHPTENNDAFQKALVWSKLHMAKETLFETQKTKPVGEIPLDMLVPQWTAPPPAAWRLRGYEPVPNVLKSSYLPHRRRVRDPIDSVQRDSPHEAATQHKSTDRHSRMASRRLAQNLNSQKQALSVDTSILDMNHLLKRRKPVKFARSAIHNWGLYAVDKIEKNEMIIEYVGEVIRAPLADLRERNYVRSGIGSSYLFRIDGQTVIDATKRGGIARFINHSCDPSCMAKIIKVEGTKRIVIYAMRDIYANEELTYDYKFEREQGVDRITCLCGASNCKGYLN